jgi:hypothetical protein
MKNGIASRMMDGRGEFAMTYHTVRNKTSEAFSLTK